jgi:hypothetical protein
MIVAESAHNEVANRSAETLPLSGVTHDPCRGQINSETLQSQSDKF